MQKKIVIEDIDEFEVHSKGKTFKVSSPTVSQIRKMNASLRAEGADEVAVMEDFCKKLGVPEDVLEVWGPRQMKQFFDQMLDEKKS